MDPLRGGFHDPLNAFNGSYYNQENLFFQFWGLGRDLYHFFLKEINTFV